MTANTQQEKLRRRGRPPRHKGCAACSHRAVLSVLVLVSSVNLSPQRQASTESVALCADCFGCLGRFVQPVGISFEKVERLLAVPLLVLEGERLTESLQFINKTPNVIDGSFLNAPIPGISAFPSDFKRYVGTGTQAGGHRILAFTTTTNAPVRSWPSSTGKLSQIK